MDNSLSRRIIVVVLVLAILVVVGAWWWKKQADEEAANLAAISQAVNVPAPEPVALEIEDQFPGPMVFVSRVHLPKGGWVAIHHDDNGAPGEIAGAGYFDKDVSSGEINLTNPSVESEVYHAVPYREVSTDGALSFDPRVDLVYRGANRLPQIQTFRITKNLPENKG